MPKRLKLSPLQRDVVVMLEEAGSETIGTVVATVKPKDQSEFTRELDELIVLGLIQKVDGSPQSRSELILTEVGRQTLRS